MPQQDTKPWTVITIPTFPTSDQHIELYKSIRLSGLLHDPQAFGSTFTKESAFTQEIWRSRVNTKGRITLMAADTEEKQAIGTLSILSPAMLTGMPQDPPYPSEIAEKEREGQVEVYVLVGMWVHPDHRAKGVGRALVNRALELIKIAPSGLPAFQELGPQQEINAKFTKVALLLVHNDQKDALRLYQAAGFIRQGELEHAGRPSTWMAVYYIG